MAQVPSNVLSELGFSAASAALEADAYEKRAERSARREQHKEGEQTNYYTAAGRCDPAVAARFLAKLASCGWNTTGLGAQWICRAVGDDEIMRGLNRRYIDCQFIENLMNSAGLTK
jgi:hypothetical protein